MSWCDHITAINVNNNDRVYHKTSGYCAFWCVLLLRRRRPSVEATDDEQRLFHLQWQIAKYSFCIYTNSFVSLGISRISTVQMYTRQMLSVEFHMKSLRMFDAFVFIVFRSRLWEQSSSCRTDNPLIPCGAPRPLSVLHLSAHRIFSRLLHVLFIVCVAFVFYVAPSLSPVVIGNGTLHGQIHFISSNFGFSTDRRVRALVCIYLM